VPVNETGTIEVVEKVHESVALPEPVKLVGVRVHDVLFEVRLTAPAKPFKAVMVKLDEPAEATSTLTFVGLAATVKSWTLYRTLDECEREALVPVTPTWIELAEAKVQDKVALPEPVTLVGFIVHDVLFVARPTRPAKLFSASTVIVDVPVLPTFTVTVGGPAVIAKSWIANVRIAEWERPALAPVTATWTVEGDVKEHEIVELPEPATLVGNSVHLVLLLVRPTTPVKLLSPVTVMVEVTGEPALPVILIGSAKIVKS